MKITVQINSEPVEITLTSEQIAQIKKQPFNVVDHVKTWDDACGLLGIDPVGSLPYPSAKNDFEFALNGIAKMMQITELLCNGWIADYSDRNQIKWYPWFEWTGSGFGFSYAYYVYWITGACVGSRLVFPTKELAEYAGKQFTHIYNTFLTKPTPDNGKKAN